MSIEAMKQERNFCERCGKHLGGEGHIHTCSPQLARKWVGLTDAERHAIYDEHGKSIATLFTVIECRLREKNNR